MARILEYWIESLEEGERASLNPKEFMANGIEIPRSDAVWGSLNAHTIRTLTLKNERREAEKHRRTTDDDRRSPEIRILICPARYARSDRGPSPPFLEVLWIPALLGPDGALTPPSVGGPWIPRDHLEPLLLDHGVSVGDSASVQRFADKHPEERWDDWAHYWSYAEQLFRAVTGANLGELEIEDYVREQTALATLDTSSAGAARASVRVLRSVLEGKRNPALLPLFAARATPKKRDYSRALRQIALSAAKHTGQFGNKFPLAPSQRLAVHRYFETPADDFLCVTGPPGTGKTTLLQSIVASLWVSAVQGKTCRPPVIVACGATNQSVMNIIDSFEKTADSNDLLSERWLPRLRSFGTFCCSATRSKDVEGYQLELMDGGGLSSRMEQAEYTAAATTSFLERISRLTNKKLSLKAAVELLRRAVHAERRALQRDIFREKDGTFAEWLRSFFGGGKKITAEQFVQALAAFDTGRRNRAFLLASHYWEGRWLLEMKSIFASVRRDSTVRGRSSKLSTDRFDWQRRAMITPAFVSTLAMTPRFFGGSPKPDFIPVDLMIFDEAGQTPVEMGVACAALAKQAVIVGDTQQLEPMWNVPPHIDRTSAARHLRFKVTDEAAWRAFEKRGLAASSGSFMGLALQSSNWIEHDPQTGRTTHGVFLREHRRSVPAIVQFNNALSYNGRLEPHRAELSERVIPPFGYVHVDGFCQQLRQSRYNQLEVNQIAAWIDQNEDKLKKFYRAEKISDIVAVITPFAAQTKKLEAKLRRRYPEMTIGTVHSLQGAERRVVIFSPVYDERFEGDYFFDRGPNMLNVAVSRAQDSFVVIGDMPIFDPNRKRAPSGVLAQFLFSDPAFELTPAIPVREEAMAAEEFRRLTTLEEHQEELFRAFEMAEQEVMIVSPTISIAAIRHDRLAEYIQSTVRRGVRIRIFTDSYLDASGGQLKENAAAGRLELARAGASVHVSKAIHNKAVTIDNHTLIEGSFNWLSAVRTVGSIHQKLEISCCYSGPNAAERIRTLRDELEHRESLLR